MNNGEQRTFSGGVTFPAGKSWKLYGARVFLLSLNPGRFPLSDCCVSPLSQSLRVLAPLFSFRAIAHRKVLT